MDGGPGQPPVCKPGLQTDRPGSQQEPGEHLPTILPTRAPCAQQLTDVPPVVGVPSTLVVGKAQLHLNTVGGTHSRAWSQWEGQPCPTFHSYARQRELRTLVGERWEQNWGVYQAVVTSQFLEVTCEETEVQGAGFV